MKRFNIYLGSTPLKIERNRVNGGYVTIDNEVYYKISNYDCMAPFFMSIVSDSDFWMFISSNGAPAAGRKNPDNALFPYYTDDKIQDSQDLTGSKTVILLTKDGKTFLWEPFSDRYHGIYKTERHICKNVTGNKLLFKEMNRDLNISFGYTWQNSEKFGFVKKSVIENLGPDNVSVRILDGIQNILPFGIDKRFQMEYSTLADGYKKNELIEDVGLGIFKMSSIPTDKAEPSEALRATVVWSDGVENSTKLLSCRQLEKFITGEDVEQEIDVRAARGAYFDVFTLELPGRAERRWYLAADINKDASDVATLAALLKNNKNMTCRINEDVEKGSENLRKIVADADGLQLTGNRLYTSRHFSNVLFNVMRGGIFDDGYFVEKTDLTSFLQVTNKNVYETHKTLIDGLPEKVHYSVLVEKAAATNDPDFEKLCREYMPLTFARRHGDPSRPWNNFSIEIKDEHGEKVLNYQGNWRDIFQNWEALAMSFPGYIDSMIAKFVNASTADGYNPYRVMRDGFDWEVLDPNDAWSYIGYWGDHQVIYLQKLLEMSAKYHPGNLQSLLLKEVYAYSNVPYRIRHYEKLLQDPQNTIDFDLELDELIAERVRKNGTDGKFVCDHKGRIYHVNLTEKLLVMVLAKLSNFIPEAGIWMNTQRPEWNDANNALVGSGVSMVTLYYMRRFLAFGLGLFQSLKNEKIAVSDKVCALFDTIYQTLDTHRTLLTGPISDTDRKKILDELGKAGERYRTAIYTNGFSGSKKQVTGGRLADFFKLALLYIEHSIRANRRDDGLYHAYNLIKVESPASISIRYLYEMLEGQVAVLSSGYLSPDECAALLKALRNSALYREDQNSYILYPDKKLARFEDNNIIPAERVKKSELLSALVKSGDKRIVSRDINGDFHFNARFRNARILKETLESLSGSRYESLVDKEKQLVLDIYESVFDHQSFTGRSGTFYKYEGLGSIYWHMVSKLVLAVQENYFWAGEAGAGPDILKKLRDYYYEIQAGIGVEKSPDLYGAFPTDPYSHTPGHLGVQQPGMTGQVKEDIISRFCEIGLKIVNGKIIFDTRLFRRSEFLTQPDMFRYYDVNGEEKSIELEAGMLAYTYCQVPVVYIKSNRNKLLLTLRDGTTVENAQTELDAALSTSIFERKDKVRKIKVFVD